MFLRLLKGQVMGLLFLVFGLGILLELLLVYPVVWLIGKLRGPDPDRMQAVHRFLMGLWLWCMRIFGLLSVRRPADQPLQGPCVIVANHPGLFDVVAIIRDVPKLSVLVKMKLAHLLPVRSIFRISGYVLSPDYESLGSAVATFSQAHRQLERGYRLLLFPEGTRSPQGDVSTFWPGAFKIARQARVPIQPILIRTSPPFMTHKDHWYDPPRRRSILEMEFWEPLEPPNTGEEERMAKELEQRYREALQTEG